MSVINYNKVHENFANAKVASMLNVLFLILKNQNKIAMCFDADTTGQRSKSFENFKDDYKNFNKLINYIPSLNKQELNYFLSKFTFEENIYIHECSSLSFITINAETCLNFDFSNLQTKLL